MTTENESDRDRLVELAQATAAHARRLAEPAVAEQADAVVAQLQSARFPVIVCGEFKRGKSSLVGALLGDAGLCPVEVDIATNLVTVVEYGPRERIEVRSAQEPLEVQRDAIADFVTEQGNPGNRRGAEFVHVSTPCERLRSGLVLMDTPGVGGLNAAHSTLTYALLPAAAAAIFVADVVEPLSASELDFAERALSYVDRVLVVLTRADLVVDPSIAIADARRKLAPLLGRRDIDLPVVAVSNHAYFDYLRSNDPADLVASNFSELESALWDLAEKDRTRILVQRSARQMRGAVERLRSPLASERAASAEDGQAAAARIEAELVATEARLAQLSSESASWRKTLTRLLEDARLDATDRVGGSWRKLNQTFAGEYLNDARLLRDPEKMSEVLSRDVALLASANAKAIEDIANGIAEEVALASGLQLDGPALPAHDVLSGAPAVPGRAPGQTTPVDVVFVYVRNAAMGGGAAAFAGGGAAALLGAVGATALATAIPPLAVALGVAAGVRFAVGQIKKEDTVARREAIRGKCLPYLQDAQAQANSNLARSLRTIERSFVEAFETQLKEDGAAVAASRKALAEARGRTAAESRSRIAEIDRALEPLDRLDAALAALAADGGGARNAAVAARPVAAGAARDEAWADV